MTNDGMIVARYINPGGPARQNDQYAASSDCTCATALQPPNAATASGRASAKPPSLTASCTTFTRADDSRPPAAKYTVMTPPPIAHPIADGMPATVSRIAPIATSCPARMNIEPIHRSSETTPRTPGLYRYSR